MNTDEEIQKTAEEIPRSPQLSPVLVYLLKGVVYRDQQPVVWNDLLKLQGKVVDYFTTIGLDLVIDEPEGFAYLRQLPGGEEENGIPRLIPRRPLSYPVSLLCMLLRKKMVEADAGGGGSRVVLSREQIVEMMRVFSPQRTNEAFTEDQIDRAINQAVDLGFLRALRTDRASDTPVSAYEVRPLLKALVDADWLKALDDKIKEYQDHANSAS